MKINLCIRLAASMLLAALPATAQTFTGTVVDERNLPVGYATVVLCHKNDSAPLQGGITGEDGRFSLKVADAEPYTVQISFVGFQTRTLESTPCDLGTITLQADTLALGEVIVIGHRPTYQAVAGGIATQIENSALAKAGTANDVIGHLAGIRRKIDGSFEVVGKGAPLVYIDNRLVRDRSELERLPSEAIRTIRLLTSPGSE